MYEKKEYTVEDIKKLQKRLNILIKNNFATKLQQDTINSFTQPIEEPENYYDGFNANFDPDSSPFAWEHYRKYYIPNFENPNGTNDNNFYFFYLRYSNQKNVYRLHAAPVAIHKNARQGKKRCCRANGNYPTMSGDTDFNFKPKHFTKALLKEVCSDTKSLLDSCKEMHHTLVNFSLMLSTGNMQGFKGKICEDRLDRFLFFLAKYYDDEDKQNTHIASFATEYNRPTLINYLDSFNDKYDYCQKIYFLYDNQLIDDLIESGKNSIRMFKDNGNLDTEKTIERIIEYIELAIRFWEAKAKYFNNPKNIVAQPKNQ